MRVIPVSMAFAGYSTTKKIRVIMKLLTDNMLKFVKAKDEVRQDGLQAGAAESVQVALRTQSKSKKGCPA